VRDDRDYKLELSDRAGARDEGASRPYLSVRFACCNVYLRIYRSADAKHYRGRCPRCGKVVNFVVGPGGTDARFFVVE
jgi:hypothetical protein